MHGSLKHKIFHPMLKFNKILKQLHPNSSLLFSVLSKSKFTPYQTYTLPGFASVSKFNFSSSNTAASELDDEEFIKVIFVGKNKAEVPVVARVGETILEVAQKNSVLLEGICEAVMACTTCHIILDKDVYESLGMPRPNEEDVLESAWGLTETSRLGCQVSITKDFQGKKIFLPEKHVNQYLGASQL